MTAAIPMIVDIRTRADALRPLYFAAQDAHEQWIETTHELESLDARLRELTRMAMAAEVDGRSDDALSAQADRALVEMVREHAVHAEHDARQLWQSAQSTLEDAAGGLENVVTTGDADVISDTASSIDLMSVDDARRTVRALEGEVLRAEMSEAHTHAQTVAEHTPLPPATMPESDRPGQVATLTRADVDRASPVAALKDPAHTRSTPTRADHTTPRLALSDPAFATSEPSRDRSALDADAAEHDAPATGTAPVADPDTSTAQTTAETAAPAIESDQSDLDPDAIEERIAGGTTAMKTTTTELKSKLKQTMLNQRLNPSENGATTLARYRGELERRAALPETERVAEDVVRERLRAQQSGKAKGSNRASDTGTRKDRGREL